MAGLIILFIIWIILFKITVGVMKLCGRIIGAILSLMLHAFLALLGIVGFGLAVTVLPIILLGCGVSVIGGLLTA